MLDDLFGGWSPEISGDVRTWDRPETLPLTGRVFAFLGAALIASAALAVLQAGGQRLAILGPTTPTLTLSVPVLAVAFAAYLVRWRTRGGWLTIDPDGRRLTLRRPWNSEPAGTWSFDDVTAVVRHPGSVTLRLAGEHGRQRVRVAPTLSAEFARSLGELTNGRDGSAAASATS